MPKDYTLGRFSRDVRMQFILLSVIFSLSFSTFYLAWGQMRYSAETLIPMEELVYWRFALAGWLPLVGFFLTAVFAFISISSAVMGRRSGMSAFGWFHIIVCGIALAWCLLFCAWEITAWTECNDPGPKHPECRNREFPEKTIADYSFIMMVIASAVNAFVMGWCMYFNSTITDRRLAIVQLSISPQPIPIGSNMNRSEETDSDYTDGESDDATDVESGPDESEQRTIEVPLSRHAMGGSRKTKGHTSTHRRPHGTDLLYSSEQGD